jgi:carbonic anhydrase
VDLPLPARAALERLVEGNRRFLAGHEWDSAAPARAKLARVARDQRPFAAILGCADARVPVEIVFAQELGDLFVVRVAGNVASPATLGSLEFAVGVLGTPLVVVLGHTRCGAVEATVEALLGRGRATGQLAAVVGWVRPAVEPLLDEEGRRHPDVLAARGVEANVRRTVDEVRRSSELITREIRASRVAVVGAVFDLDTGEVGFLNA